jgi:nitrous oxidase accessory protein NosD
MGRSRKTSALLLVLLFIMPLVLLPSPTVKAQSKTVIVPDNYPTVTSAIGNATDGDTIIIKSGVYEENAITTNKSLYLTGEGYQSTIINLKSSSHEIVIDVLGHTATFYDPALTVNASNFSISGLTIKSNGGDVSINGNNAQITSNNVEARLGITGSNLYITENYFSTGGISANYSAVSDNLITNEMGFGGEYSIFTSNNITNQAPSIQTNNCLITKNNIYNAPFAIFPLYGNGNIFSDNFIDHLSFGLWVSGSNNTIMKNKITHCGVALQPNANNTYYGNDIENNLWGVDTVGSLMNPDGKAHTFFNNNLQDNKYQVNTLSTSRQDYFDNGERGNYWSDYHGTDSNNDGIGDTPYIIDSNRLDRYPLISKVNISAIPDLLPNWAVVPNVLLNNPTNTTYSNGNIELNFVIDKQPLWIGYSLDGQENITIVGNATLTNLAAGIHNITIFSTDSYHNIGMSSTVIFSVENVFPTSIIIAIVILAVIGLSSLLLYRRHRKTQTTWRWQKLKTN